jgi:SAM-dependent methyltransferase
MDNPLREYKAQPFALEVLRCPTHHVALTLSGNQLVCPDCHVVGNLNGQVASFLAQHDEFYEGKYSNRMKFIPKGEGFFATLPLRIVHQGYSFNVSRALPKGSTVVEIGCAGGIDWFAKRYTMIGLDLSVSALRIAALHYHATVQCDATQMPLANGSADGVISSCLFEHLLPDQKLALLSESYRVLKPGGKLVFSYDIWTDNPVISAYRRRQPELYEQLFLDGDSHLGYESIERNHQHFDAAGFDITDERYHERTPFLANSAWQKFAQWPGVWGAAAAVARTATSGAARLPCLAAQTLVDETVGRLLPPRFARGVTTVARKR